MAGNENAVQLKPEVQVFGEHELLDRIAEGKQLYSHCISIRNPDMQMPQHLRHAFKEVLELKFFDVLEGPVADVTNMQAPTEEDAKKVVEFISKTRNKATEYTIHCWGGHSRSTAAALAVLYMILGNEEEAAEYLLNVRPDPKPSPNLTFLTCFDRLLGSNLVAIGTRLQAAFIEQLDHELDVFFPSDGIEELPIAEQEPYANGLLAKAAKTQRGENETDI
jgi:predicted protein tyrosine phosphatase